MACPRPRAPPVTRAVRPVRSKSVTGTEMTSRNTHESWCVHGSSAPGSHCALAGAQLAPEELGRGPRRFFPAGFPVDLHRDKVRVSGFVQRPEHLGEIEVAGPERSAIRLAQMKMPDPVAM